MDEKTVKAQIHSFPSGLLKAIKNQPDWELVTVSTDPRPDGQSNYEVHYQDQCVIRFSRWNGYGFGSSAVYPIMKFSDFELLKSIYPNQCRVWKVL